MWHVHMLSPLDYERDCNEIVSTLVDHRILVGEQRELGLKKARRWWNQLYSSTGEPFEVDLTVPLGKVPSFKSKIQYDIVAACGRQRVFNYQVSLPHFDDQCFLAEALARYKQHLMFKREHPDTFFVPCYDFDLIWHAHQVHPLIYRNNTAKILGKVLNHNDSVNDRRPGSKLSTSEKTTREIWAESGLEFAVNGAMFRGESPSETSKDPNTADYSSLAIRRITWDLTELKIDGLPKNEYCKIRIDLPGGKVVFEKRFKGPAATIIAHSKYLSRFTFTTEMGNFLSVRYF